MSNIHCIFPWILTVFFLPRTPYNEENDYYKCKGVGNI